MENYIKIVEKRGHRRKKDFFFFDKDSSIGLNPSLIRGYKSGVTLDEP